MIKKVLLSFVAIVLVGIGVLVYFAVPHLTSPKFNVSNSGSEPVQVIAYWRDKNKNLGTIAPGEKVEFELNGEAGISFEVKYPNGKVVTSTDMYFTLGTSINAEITKKGIDVNYGPRGWR